ncbi:MFS transporter [Sphingopyxis panaciterrulae]|uniref:MFS family permease n=1 Tax=Sphingopyxis panaciterrulae TaxID=462372 RepID=A0A7W9EQQ6_9SPHN|nr:MFS transporter [Sphingopyxis panaciterrulae]MBB5706754.1 MFS family permease [Sphingopyxis panaciterrulae]
MTARRNLPLLIAALWIAEVTGSFETAMILAALKRLIEDFGNPAMVGWLITGYLIVGAAIAAVVGRLGDLFGRRRILIAVLLIGAAGSLISALSGNFAILLTGRLMQGVTGAILPLCIGLVHENLGQERAPMGIGLMISGASIGTAAGLVVGGMIVDSFNWHGIFFTSAGLCLCAVAATRAFVPASPLRKAPAPVDWVSGLAFAPGVALILVYFSMGKGWGWANGWGLAALIAGLSLVVWWVRQSLASPNPLIAVRSFSNRTIAVGCAVTALVSMGTLQITVFFSLLMQAPVWTAAGLGFSATLAGVAKLPSNLSSTLAGPLGGWLAGRGGGRFALVAGGLVTTAGWLLWFLVDVNSFLLVVAQLILISFGATMLFSVAPTVIAQASPPERISEISGMLTVIRQLFLGIGAQMVTTLLAVDVVRRGGESYPSPFAYDLAVIAIVALCVGAILLSFLLPRTIEPDMP